jgi:arylsulfatase A-like enzyme
MSDEKTKQPNIVAIMSDDVGIWNIGAYHRGMMVRGPVNSPPEAGSIRHPRPVETATPGRRHRAVRRGKLPLTNNFIWKEEKSSIRIFLL